MSESNGHGNGVYVLPDGLFKFTTPDGKAWTLDLIEAHLKVNALSAEAGKYEEYWHLREFQKWMLAQIGQTLPLGQCDLLYHAIRMEHARQKKEQLRDLESIATSLSSTALTPADSAP